MRFPGWVPNGIHIPSRIKWDAPLLLALFLFNFFNFSAWLHLSHITTNPWSILPWLFGLIGLIPLFWRNSAPVTVFATQWLLAVTAWSFMREYNPVVGIPLALYAVALRCPLNISLLTLVLSFVSSACQAYAVSSGPRSTPYSALVVFISNGVFFTLMAIGAWILGRSVGRSQRHQQYLEREQEKAREAEVLATERRKIARELHDIVSHSVTVIVLQANGASSVADTDFAHITDADFTQIKQSLAHITTTGAQTMAELRRLLSVLETGDALDESASINNLKPQPGLMDLAALLDSIRVTGMPVTVYVEGAPRQLDPSVDLTAYRIVQEGLTNVLKHAGKCANARLWLIWKPQKLLIQLDNDTNLEGMRGKSALSAGRGLVGLRERVHAVGGKLEAGPQNEGGYRLIATLPFAIPDSSPALDVSSQSQENQGKVTA
jgi:signal transduction histidine kinase